MAFFVPSGERFIIIPKSELSVDANNPYVAFMHRGEIVAQWDADSILGWADDIDVGLALIISWMTNTEPSV
jgi:hypothetical protein